MRVYGEWRLSTIAIPISLAIESTNRARPIGNIRMPNDMIHKIECAINKTLTRAKETHIR